LPYQEFRQTLLKQLKSNNLTQSLFSLYKDASTLITAINDEADKIISFTVLSDICQMLAETCGLRKRLLKEIGATLQFK